MERIQSLYKRVLGHAGAGTAINQGVSLVMLRAINIALGLLVVAILTNTLGPDGYGLYAVFVASAVFLGLIVHLGTPTFLIKEIAASLASGRPARARGLEKFTQWLVSLMGAVILAAIALLANSSISSLIFGPLAPFAILVAIAAIAYGWQQRLVGILGGRNSLIFAHIPDAVVRPVSICLLALLYFSCVKQSVQAAIAIYVCAAFIAIAVATVFVIRTSPTPPLRGEDVDGGRKWLFQLPPFFAISLVSIAQANADIIVLAATLPLGEVGTFKVAALLAAIPANFHAVVIGILRPRAAAASALNDMVRLSRIAIKTSRITLFFALVYLTAFYFLGPIIIATVFGEVFAEAYNIAMILILANVLTTSVGASFTVLNMHGLVKLNTVISVTSLILGLVGMWMAAQTFGLAGAAWAAVGMAAILALSSWCAVWLRIGIRCDAFALRQTVA